MQLSKHKKNRVFLVPAKGRNFFLWAPKLKRVIYVTAFYPCCKKKLIFTLLYTVKKMQLKFCKFVKKRFYFFKKNASRVLVGAVVSQKFEKRVFFQVKKNFFRKNKSCKKRVFWPIGYAKEILCTARGIPLKTRNFCGRLS